MRIHWHRRDLRIEDNPALTVNDMPVVGVYVIDARTRDIGAPQQQFLADALRELRAAYREHDGELYIRSGEPVDVLQSLCNSHDATQVSTETAYAEPFRTVEQRVYEELDTSGLETISIGGRCLHPPWSITTNDGDPYKVFTYFGRKWMRREKQSPVRWTIEGEAPVEDAGAIDTLDVETDVALPEAGTAPARERLAAFCDNRIFAYEDRRDRPDKRATSRLSADIVLGTIGIREVWAATAAARDAATTDAERSSVAAFQRQLAWREFYTAMFAARPDMTDTNLAPFEHTIDWRTDQAALEAWKRGETGFPIVDAGMRQLLAEGFMHNRLRMIVGSFLTKDLLIDWREGRRWFEQWLVDHDPANNAGGWQWAASVGTDAQPYFRIFNPMTQGERHDPDAVYIKRYIDELADVPADVIHDWTALDADTREQHAPEYPAPIVDHATRREAALEMYRSAKGEESGE